jgi:hypothetical protein
MTDSKINVTDETGEMQLAYLPCKRFSDLGPSEGQDFE